MVVAPEAQAEDASFKRAVGPEAKATWSSFPQVLMREAQSLIVWHCHVSSLQEKPLGPREARHVGRRASRGEGGQTPAGAYSHLYCSGDEVGAGVGVLLISETSSP